MNITQLHEQHKNIEVTLNDIDQLISKNDFTQLAGEIARKINQLAGILKVHLGTEDRFLYPSLLKSEDEKVRLLTKKYVDEMGGIQEAYTKFKLSYNTAGKINQDVEGFLKEYKATIEALKKRLDKEETELYRIAETL